APASPPATRRRRSRRTRSGRTRQQPGYRAKSVPAESFPVLIDGRVDSRRLGIIEPTQDNKAAVPPAGVEPLADPEVARGDRDTHMSVSVWAYPLIGHRAMPVVRLQTLMPDVFQCDIPIAGGRRPNVEYQGLVGLEPKGSDHVQIVRCGVGGAEVSGLGCQQGGRLFDELGFDGAVQRGQL